MMGLEFQIKEKSLTTIRKMPVNSTPNTSSVLIFSLLHKFVVITLPEWIFGIPFK
jgi:hypothetical protein